MPKVEGANTIDKLRDLEIGNEVRKVLARMLFKVLDEVCQHESHSMHSKLSCQDVTSSAARLCCVAIFWDAHGEAVHDDDPYLLLAP